jgi:hypothetical protein
MPKGLGHAFQSKVRASGFGDADSPEMMGNPRDARGDPTHEIGVKQKALNQSGLPLAKRVREFADEAHRVMAVPMETGHGNGGRTKRIRESAFAL